MKINKQGFTLVETLLVLLIVCTFILLPSISFARYQETLEKNQFFSTFEQRLLLTQQLAITENVKTGLIPSTDEQLLYFNISAQEKEDWQILTLPKGVVLNNNDSVFFSGGSGANSGALVRVNFSISGFDKRLSYVFQMGSNRFEKEWI